MITDNDLIFNYEGVPGVALVWVIDEDCLYDAALTKEHADIFLESDEVVDISDEYPDYEGIVVRFFKNNTILEELKTTEYFGSILLSNPTLLKLSDYPYGRYVESPNAKFDGQKFIITNRDVEGWDPFPPSKENNIFIIEEEQNEN